MSESNFDHCHRLDCPLLTLDCVGVPEAGMSLLHRHTIDTNAHIRSIAVFEVSLFSEAIYDDDDVDGFLLD